MPLALLRDGPTRAPWRLAVTSTDGRQPRTLPHARFRRKREALALYTALARLPVPWDEPPETWDPALRQHIVDLVYGTTEAREDEAFAAQRYAAIVAGRASARP